MSVNISAFPVLTSSMLNNIGFYSDEYIFFTERNGERINLISEPSKTYADEYIIKSPENISWSIESDNIGISRNISFEDLDCLFGTNGIAAKKSEIGIAVLWTSSDSHQRGCINIGTIKNGDKKEEFNISNLFEKGKLRGLVSLTLIFYINKAGVLNPDEFFLANTEGYVIGALDSINFILDGDGSIFPIYFESEDSSAPLWRIECDWEEPDEDKFSECVKIIINTSNPSFKYIDHERETYNKFMFQEIISSCLLIIIEKLKDNSDLEHIKNGSGKTRYDGTVSSAVKYILDGLDTSSIESLSLSLRDKRTKEIE